MRHCRRGGEESFFGSRFILFIENWRAYFHHRFWWYLIGKHSPNVTMSCHLAPNFSLYYYQFTFHLPTPYHWTFSYLQRVIDGLVWALMAQSSGRSFSTWTNFDHLQFTTNYTKWRCRSNISFIGLLLMNCFANYALSICPMHFWMYGASSFPEFDLKRIQTQFLWDVIIFWFYFVHSLQ